MSEMPFFLKQAICLLTFLITFQFLGQELFSEKAPHPSPNVQKVLGKSHAQTNTQLSFQNEKCNILIWGGGYSPSGNQISLESNIRYFGRIRVKIGLGGFPMKTLRTMHSKNKLGNFTIRKRLGNDAASIYFTAAVRASLCQSESMLR